MARTIVAFTALTTLAGTEIGLSEPKLINQARIDAFADATDDHQWIHVDAKRAASGPYGRTIGHGFLTLSLCAAFLTELVEVSGAAWGVNYGLDRVRFPAPVPEGSHVRDTLSVISADEAAHGMVQVVYRHVLTVDGADKPSCIAEMIVRYGA